MNPIKIFVTLLLLIAAITAQAQDRTCYDRLRTLGIEDYNAKKYEAAIKKWEIAKTCSYVPPDNDIDNWIKKAKNQLNAPPPTRQPYEPEMVFVQGGTFTMGYKDGRDSDCLPDEKPAHQVTLSDFYIGKYEVTQAQWRAIMGNNPSNNKNCDQCPVDQISWNDVQEFIKKLNERSGKNYRLPSEAEWEYAARGGNQSQGYKYAGSNTLDEVGWFWKNSGDKNLFGDWIKEKIDQNNCKTHPVGQKKANELGIFDMSGNVWEWCSDWATGYPSDAQTNPKGPVSGTYRVVRSGCWIIHDYYCRVSSRNIGLADDRDHVVGFRLAGY